MTDTPEEAEAGAPSDEATGAGTKGGAEAGSTAPSADVSEAGDGEAVTEVAEVVEAVEIPKQQSAEEAADNEAGEGARK
ncbi:gliding motility protein [Streptomyces sp. NPDC001774]